MSKDEQKARVKAMCRSLAETGSVNVYSAPQSYFRSCLWEVSTKCGLLETRKILGYFNVFFLPLVGGRCFILSFISIAHILQGISLRVLAVVKKKKYYVKGVTQV